MNQATTKNQIVVAQFIEPNLKYRNFNVDKNDVILRLVWRIYGIFINFINASIDTPDKPEYDNRFCHAELVSASNLNKFLISFWRISMINIEIKKIEETELEKLGIDTWGEWECAPSEFNWKYSQTETSYFIEGKVKIKTDNEEVLINKGDLVKFPKGLKCKWIVLEKVKKYYKFS